ncbi:hypothetical protein OAO18_03915, partial [Francisellaceae bacterium]|nr:hypothetical protein [Francisellaceae bacterium]
MKNILLFITLSGFGASVFANYNHCEGVPYSCGYFDISNQTGQDLRLVETYKAEGKLYRYESACIKPKPISDANSYKQDYARIYFTGGFGTDEGPMINGKPTNSVKSAEIVEYSSTDGSCSADIDPDKWPTYYQPNPIVTFNPSDFSWQQTTSDWAPNAAHNFSTIHYTVVKNSQDTPAQKASPATVLNRTAWWNNPVGSPSFNIFSVATYGNMVGAIYYVPDVSKKAVFIDNSIDPENPGSIQQKNTSSSREQWARGGPTASPYNEYVYINNTLQSDRFKYPTYLV